MCDIAEIKALLLDVEGTTTSISFVKETLFPYVREHVKTYIDGLESEEFNKVIKAFSEQASKDASDNVEGLVPIKEGDDQKESLVANVLWQMENDRKTGALKSLQGEMWKKAYEGGDFKGHVFPDVPESLRDWTSSSRKVFIYSSGSVEAQKLLFKNSSAGDLLEFISGHFDVAAGPKTDKNSYMEIAKEIGHSPNEILFLTDVVKEAEAAKAAGMKAAVVLREGNAVLSEEELADFNTVTSFSELEIKPCAKRAKTDLAEEQKPAEEGKPSETPVEANGAEPMEAETAEEVPEETKEEAAKVEDKSPEEPIDVEDTKEVVEEKKEPEEKVNTENSSESVDVTSTEEVAEKPAVNGDAMEKEATNGDSKPQNGDTIEKEATNGDSQPQNGDAKAENGKSEVGNGNGEAENGNGEVTNGSTNGDVPAIVVKKVEEVAPAVVEVAAE